MTAKAQFACGPNGIEENEVRLLQNINKVFPFELVVYYARKEDIEKLKDAGLSGISRKQRKHPLKV